MSFFINLEVGEYDDRADISRDEVIVKYFGITNNPKGILTAMGEEVENKYPELKKIKWASAEDLDELENQLEKEGKSL